MAATDPRARLRVLVLDDSPLQHVLLCEQLERIGCEVEAAATPAEAHSKISRTRPDLVLVELIRGGGNGFEDGVRLLEKRGIATVLMSASGRATDAPWAARLGFAATLRRPCTTEQLRACLAAGQRTEGG